MSPKRRDDPGLAEILGGAGRPLLSLVALLLPFAFGLWRTRAGLRVERSGRAWRPPLTSARGLGRGLLMLVGIGMLLAGSVIVTIGSFVVFVPQDLAFIGLDRAQLDTL